MTQTKSKSIEMSQTKSNYSGFQNKILEMSQSKSNYTGFLDKSLGAMEVEEGEGGPSSNKPEARNQILAAGVVSGVATVSIGTVLGFSAVLLPELEQEVHLDKDQASWIASLSNIGQLFGAIVSGMLSQRLGRKVTMMLLCFPLLAGWIVIGLSNGNLEMLYIGRILQGVGVMSSVTQVYLVEIADTSHRGMFGASGALSVSVGITLTFCLGALLPWRLVCVACGSLPVATFILMFLLPETPAFLVLKGRTAAAKTSLKWLRGSRYDITGELEGLEAAQGGGGQDSSFIDTLAAFGHPSAYKPFVILNMVFLLQQCTGTYAIIFYAVGLFKDIGVSANPYLAAIIVGSIRLIGSLIGTILLKKFGRKPLMIVSALLMCVFMASLAICVYYKQIYYIKNCLDASQLNTTDCPLINGTHVSKSLSSTVARNKLFLDNYPIVAVILYMLSFGLGVATVPWLLLGELCPSKVKGVASGITVFVAFLTIFGVVKSFPFCLAYLGPHGTYGVYSAVCLVMAVYTWAYVPETRGKSLAQLQTLFGKEGDTQVLVNSRGINK